MRGVPVKVGGGSSLTSPLGRCIVLAAMFALVLVPASVGTAQTTQATPSGSQTLTITADELKALQQEAGQGDAAAACQLGTIYEAGQVVPKDYAEAFKWSSVGVLLSGDVQNACVDNHDRLRKQMSAEQRAEGDRREKEWYEAVHFTLPTVLESVIPHYAKDALKAKIKGEVGLYAVIGADGTVTRCRIWQPLDDRLDLEAVKAVRQWRFTPARIGNRAVPVVVPISLTFDFRE